jgi:outer membrane protein OmpA-like peptidoglycan-associated protein
MKPTRLLFALSILLLTAATVFAIDPGSPFEKLPDIILYGPDRGVPSEGLKAVPFDFDDHMIDNPNETKALEQTAAWLKAHPDVRFYVFGYADSRGDVLYNMSLSQRRADAVKNGLVKLGVAPERILMSVGWGELYPSCGGEAENCWAQNRRVRVVDVSPRWVALLGGM